MPRITSYNVCYTKLLRQKVDRVRRGGDPVPVGHRPQESHADPPRSDCESCDGPGGGRQPAGEKLLRHHDRDRESRYDRRPHRNRQRENGPSRSPEKKEDERNLEGQRKKEHPVV